jgi:hypothetical protein
MQHLVLRVLDGLQTAAARGQLPWVNADNVNLGYILRGLHLLPKQGNKLEWQHTQDYWLDKHLFLAIDLDEAILVYQ